MLFLKIVFEGEVMNQYLYDADPFLSSNVIKKNFQSNISYHCTNVAKYTHFLSDYLLLAQRTLTSLSFFRFLSFLPSPLYPFHSFQPVFFPNLLFPSSSFSLYNSRTYSASIHADLRLCSALSRWT